MTPGRLSGKIALITGAASGIGAETAQLFASQGASVLIADLQEEKGEALADDIRAHGGVASFIRADVTCEADIASMVATAVDRYGRLDILYNNAGGGVAGQDDGTTSLERLTAADWDRAHALNLRSVFLAIKCALPHLRRAGGGAILSTGSSAGIRGLRGTEVYNVMKAGLHMLTTSMAQTLGPENIRINAIAPGWTATPMLLANFPPGADRTILPIAQPIQRAGTPRDIANAALFLVSDEASFITGIVLPVDGGWSAQGDQNAQLTLHLAGIEKPEWS